MADTSVGAGISADWNQQGNALINNKWEHKGAADIRRYEVEDIVTFQSSMYQCILQADITVNDDSVPTNAMYWKLVGAGGSANIEIAARYSNGNILKGVVRSTDLIVDVSINEELQSEAAHATYNYKWTYNGAVLCVNDQRQIINDSSGYPLVSTDGGMTCSLNSVDYLPADSTVSTMLGSNLRSIVVDTADVLDTAQILCEVSNIP